MKILEDKNRIFGLDLVRFFAITFVLIAHAISVFLIPYTQNAFLRGVLGRVFSYPLGFFGVEIFFVLSGYLIGTIIIKKIVQNKTLKELFNFYIRRWFRTLPLYFLVVFLLLFNPYVNSNFSWKSLVFLQNFSQSALEFNPVSWSLAVEEWFYLLIPFLFFILFKINKKREDRFFVIVCSSIVILSIIARVFYVGLNNPSFDFGIRRHIFLRLDSLTIGILFAGVKYYYSYIYDFFQKNKIRLFVISSLCLIATYLFIILHSQFELDESFFARVFLTSIISFICGFLLFSIENFKFSNKISKVITFVSIISYGLYLIHLSVFSLFQNIFKAEHLLSSLLVMIFSLFITFIFSYTLYKYYEFPLMNLRDRLTLK